MSETLSLWPSQGRPLFRPQMMIGAASPLWGYFAGAALTGVAFWWMTRWMPSLPVAEATAPAPRAGRVPKLVVVEPVEEPVIDAEFVPAPPRPRKSKPTEVKPH